MHSELEGNSLTSLPTDAMNSLPALTSMFVFLFPPLIMPLAVWDSQSTPCNRYLRGNNLTEVPDFTAATGLTYVTVSNNNIEHVQDSFFTLHPKLQFLFAVTPTSLSLFLVARQHKRTNAQTHLPPPPPPFFFTDTSPGTR